MVIIPSIHFSFRKGGGSAPEIVYGKVEIRPTTPFQASTSLVLPAPTTIDLINGEGTAPNVYPTPAPVNGQVEWAYRVKVTDRHGKTFEWMVGVPDTTGTVEFASLPRYYETKPPLFGQGPKGDPGEAATIAVGTVTGGATAQVTNAGTNTDAVLNFVLPKGDKGDTGAGVPAGGTALQYVRKNSGNTATEWATLNKAAVGLGNVDNTSDANKPVSVAQAAAIASSNTLGYRAKTATSAPTDYPEGVTVFIGTSADGWPGAPGGVADSVRVVTHRAIGDQNAIQYLSARLPSSGVGLSDNKILYRTSNTAGAWGDFQELGSGGGNELITPERFGAVGDGVADDTQAIVDAIEYAYGERFTGIKTVTFTPGRTYNTVARIRLRGQVNYEAMGATFVKNSVASGYAVFYTRSDGAKGYGSGDSNFRWRGGTFKGDFTINNMICPFALHHTDNAEFSDFVCDQVQGIGHTFDLLGCSNIKIHDFVMRGFKNSSTGGYQKSECIQIDVSAAGASSGVDTAGSYDGLMTRDVEVYNGLFTSTSAGGLFYGAPNPIGSHAQVETQIPRNINFHHNRIVNPTRDTVSGLFGGIHFVGGAGIYVEDNKWEYTIYSPDFAANLVGLYSTNWGTAWNGANFESGASNTQQALAEPLVISDVRIARNTVNGVRADSPRLLFFADNKADSTAVVQAERITVDSNSIVCGTGTQAINCFDFRKVTGLNFVGVNSVTGPIRAVNSTDCTAITVQNFEIVGTRSDAVRFDNFKRLRILSMSSVQSSGTSIYLGGGEDLEIGGAIIESLSSSRAIAVNGVNIFTVANIKSKSPSGVVAVQVYSNSTNGFVSNVIASGGTTTAVQNGSTSTTVTNEKVVA